MLGTRIITAVILLIVLGGALALPTPWPFMLLLSLLTGLGLWEWLRLTSSVQSAPAVPSNPAEPKAAGGAIVAGLAAGALTVMVTWIWLSDQAYNIGPVAVTYEIATRVLIPLAAALWILAGTYQVVRGDVKAPAANPFMSLFGILALLATWSSLALMFIMGKGLLLLTFLAIIWCADIGAYFAGRAFGKRKLAPRVSPGKSWEGAIAGVVAAVVWGAATMGWEGSFANHLLRSWSYAALPWIAFIAMLSIVGDLFESLLKRRAGMKDSSGLLPGHGGVLDRIDAILPTAPLALMLLIHGISYEYLP